MLSPLFRARAAIRKRARTLVFFVALCLAAGCGEGGTGQTHYIYVPHYRMVLADEPGEPRPTVYEYVLTEHPPTTDTGLLKGLTAYADSLDGATNADGRYNLRVAFYKSTRNTRTFELHEKDPYELANIRLYDHVEAYIGECFIARCLDDTTRKTVRLTLVDSSDEYVVLAQRTFVVTDECTPAGRKR